MGGIYGVSGNIVTTTVIITVTIVTTTIITVTIVTTATGAARARHCESAMLRSNP